MVNVLEMFFQIRKLGKFTPAARLLANKWLLSRMLIPQVVLEVVAALEGLSFSLAIVPFANISTSFVSTVQLFLFFDVITQMLS